ncbi:MAG: hypothetical protein KDK07_24220 [Bauldia sp.]|nr:hypothetical protein [Bauldia sp.]
MTIRLDTPERRESDADLDLQALLHPAGAFAHPDDVVRDPDLTVSEKRAILASWASDVCSVESAPELRIAQAGARPVAFDDVMDALRDLDRQAADYGKPKPRYRRVLAERSPGVLGRKTARAHGRYRPRGAA